MDRYCVQCGSLLSQDASFCEQCGANNKISPETESLTKIGNRVNNQTRLADLSTKEVPFILKNRDFAKILAIIGILIILISLFIPSHLQLTLQASENASETGKYDLSVDYSYSSSIEQLIQSISDFKGLPLGILDIFISLAAIFIATIGLVKKNPSFISISGVLCLISYIYYVYHSTGFDFDISSLMMFSIIIIAIIIAIFGFLKEIVKYYFISILLCVLSWFIFFRGFQNLEINSIWMLVFLAGAIILMVSGTMMMKSGEIA
jgi:hypothetical protein